MWSGSSGGFSALHPTGNNVWGGLIEGCYTDCSNALGGSNAGIAFAGAPQGLIIAHNTAIGCNARGVHVDTPGSFTPKAARGVIIRDNRIYNCSNGIAIGGNSDTPIRTDMFENFVIESNTIEMVGGATGIFLSGSTTGFQVKNNTILKSPNAPSTNSYRNGIYVSPGSQSHVITGNRFGPSGDPFFSAITPSVLSSPAFQNNKIEDNTWTSDIGSAKTFTSVRRASTTSGILPPGSAYWTFTLGGGEADSNPTSTIASSSLDGTNYYEYMRLSRAAGSYVAGYNVWLDPAGTSGVYVGSQSTGNLTAGGWISANTGVGIAQGGKFVVVEGGTKPRMGLVTLVNGVATVNTTAVTANSRIFLTTQQDGGTPGASRVSSRTLGTGFVIKSTSTTDLSQVAWLIVDPSY